MFRMARLHDDIFYLIALELSAGCCGPSSLVTLTNLSSVSRSVRAFILPLLFSKASWPHKRKADDVHGLYFFPETLWIHFRHFTLDWPHEWLDPFPPKWGDYGSDPYSRGYYVPRHLDPLISALPILPITSFTLRCPFIPPTALVAALLKCKRLASFACEDTPLDCTLPPQLLPALTSMSLTAVGEGIRIGDGKVDPRISDVFFWARGWKKRYRARRELRLPMEVGTATLLCARHASRLQFLQLSGDLCLPSRLAACDWPVLEVFVLTGHVPPHDCTPLSVALARMPQVRDVRLLLAKSQDCRVLAVLPLTSRMAMLPRTLTHFAVSTACALTGGLLARGPALTSVAIVSIMDFPRLPIALSLGEAARLVTDISEGSRPRQLRIMIEDKLTPHFCAGIAAQLPLLEKLEIEICGYHDGKPVFEWWEFAHALAPLTHLHALRICIQFPEFDDCDGAPWWDVRAHCAAVLAEQLPSLGRVGLEFRERTGTHKYQDSWLEFEIIRGVRDTAGKDLDDEMGGGRGLTLVPQPMRSYVFPEVWETSAGAYDI